MKIWPLGAVPTAGPVMRGVEPAAGKGMESCSHAPVERLMTSIVSTPSWGTKQFPCLSKSSIGGDLRHGYSVPPLAPSAAFGSYSLGVTRQTAQPSGGGQFRPRLASSAIASACFSGSQHELFPAVRRVRSPQGASLSAPLRPAHTSPVTGHSRMQWGPPTWTVSPVAGSVKYVGTCI